MDELWPWTCFFLDEHLTATGECGETLVAWRERQMRDVEWPCWEGADHTCLEDESSAYLPGSSYSKGVGEVYL